MIKHYRNYTLYLLIICSFFCYGQQNSVADTLVKKQTLLLKKMIIPLSLTASALAINNSKFEEDLQPRINRDLTTNIDDYTRYVPLAAIYIADGFGVPAQNHWFDQTKNAALSLIITQLVTKGLKANIDKERPNGEDNRAFPSGHTSAAFASATLLFEEFRDSAPILAYSGYVFAISTAYLRMAKNKHWLSDVVLGSAIGIGITKLVYHFDYLFAWNPFKNLEKLVIAPKIDMEGTGLFVSLQF